jgi:glyoxylase-like metal-dependent hydrolase (beta-lactamase superfamily II)
MTNSYRIILAPNSSLPTGTGTNTIVLGSPSTGAIIIDPAEDQQEYLATIIQEGQVRGGIRRILITHGHPDHVGGAMSLRTQLGIPILAFSRQGVAFADEEIADGTTFLVGEDSLRAIYTPGHRFDHLCFLLEKQHTLFAGDLLASNGTVVIPPPPEGDLLDYMNSLKRVQSLAIDEIVPAHGQIITNPQEKLADYIQHRQMREQQLLNLLHSTPQGIDIHTMVQVIYATTDTRLHDLAKLSITAHLHKLEREGRVKQINSEQDRQLGYWVLI